MRAAGAVLAAALLSAVMVVVAVRSRPAVLVRSVENGGDWYARTPAWFTSRGLYPTEHTPDGAPFAWAGARARLQIPQLDRGAARELRLRVRSGRDDTVPPVTIRVLVDGVEAAPLVVHSAWQDVSIALPAARGRGATVALDAQDSFVPGPQDPRALAFMIDRLSLDARGAAMSPSARVVWAVAAFAGAIALAGAVCLLPIWTVGVAGLAAGAAVTTLLLFDAAYLGPYARELPPLALAAAAAAALGSLVASRASTTTQWGWRTALFLAVAVSALKLAVFVHPDAPTGDAMFHVHRAQAVRAGQYLFTSVTPRPFYEFPYPIGLYVVAQSLWETFPDRVVLLRGVTIIADAMVALALFAVAAARWSVATGVVAAAFALAVPVVTQSVSTANLTNVFAQSSFSLAVAWMGWSLSSTFPAISALVTAALLTSSYLSHFSTAVIGIPAAILMAIVVAGARNPAESRQWRWIASAVAVAIVVSYAVYYSHFHDVYLRTWSRVGQESASTSLVATLGEHSESKSMTVGRFLLSNYGWAALVLTIVGIATSIRRGWRDAWSLTLLAFTIVVVAFLLLGALTPIEMRANLAAHPLVALFAALGCTSLWASDRAAARAACVLAVGMTVWAGIAALAAVLTG